MKIGIGLNHDILIDITKLNKHGIVAGSSGSGKSTTIKTIAKQLNNNGIPSLFFDSKGDLKDLLQECNGSLKSFKGLGDKLTIELNTMGIDMLTTFLELNTTQSGILATCFLIAQDKGITIKTVNDIEILFNYIVRNNERLVLRYGRLSNVSINTIRRKVNTLKLNGLEQVFNQDNFNNNDIINGGIHVIDCIELVKYPKLYAAIVTTILQQFYDNLSESEQENPKAIIFIDEAHLLFKRENKEMTEKVTQIVKLIRSKGIGIIFISQSIYDIPNEILNQLTLKIQHQLHLVTTKDYTQARAISRTFTSNKETDKGIEQLKSFNTGKAFIQYDNNDQITNDIIQVDYIMKSTITDERMNELTSTQTLAVEPNNSMNNGINQVKQLNTEDKIKLIVSIMFMLFILYLFI